MHALKNENTAGEFERVYTCSSKFCTDIRQWKVMNGGKSSLSQKMEILTAIIYSCVVLFDCACFLVSLKTSDEFAPVTSLEALKNTASGAKGGVPTMLSMLLC